MCGEYISVSHERIYQHVLQDKKQGGDLYTYLRCQKKRKKRYGRQRNAAKSKIASQSINVLLKSISVCVLAIGRLIPSLVNIRLASLYS